MTPSSGSVRWSSVAGIARVTGTGVLPEAVRAVRGPRSLPRGGSRGRGSGLATAIAMNLNSGTEPGQPEQELPQQGLMETLSESMHLWRELDEMMLADGIRLHGR